MVSTRVRREKLFATRNPPFRARYGKVSGMSMTSDQSLMTSANVRSCQRPQTDLTLPTDSRSS